MPANMFSWTGVASPIPLRTIASEPYTDTLPGGKNLVLTVVVIARNDYNAFSGLGGQPQIKIGSYQDITLTVYESNGEPNYRQRAKAVQAYIQEWSLLSDTDDLSVYRLTAVGNWSFEDFSGELA